MIQTKKLFGMVARVKCKGVSAFFMTALAVLLINIEQGCVKQEHTIDMYSPQKSSTTNPSSISTMKFNAAAIDPTGKYLVTTSRGSGIYSVQVWNLTDGQPIRRLKGNSGIVFAVTFDSSGKYVIATGADKKVQIWEWSTGELRYNLQGPNSTNYALGINNNSKILAAGGMDKIIRLWDFDNGKLIKKLSGHTGTICVIKFGPFGKYMASGAYKGEIILWDLRTAKMVRSFKTEGMVLGLEFDPSGKRLLSGDYKGKVIAWDIESGKQNFTVNVNEPSQTAYILHVATLPDGKSFISVDSSGFMKTWNLANGSIIKQIKGHLKSIEALAIDPFGRFIVTGSTDRKLKIWKYPGLKQAATLYEYPDAAAAVTMDLFFHGTGNIEKYGSFPQSFASLQKVKDALYFPLPAEKSQTVQLVSEKKQENIEVDDLLDSSSLKTELVLQLGHTELVNNMLIDKTGKYLFSRSLDKTDKLWDIESGRVLRTYSNEEELSFNPISLSTELGKNIFSTHNKKTDNVTVVVSELKSNETIQSISGSFDHVKYTPDFRYLITGESIMLEKRDSFQKWDLDTGKRIQTFGGDIYTIDQMQIDPGSKYLSVKSLNKLLIYELNSGRLFIKIEHSDNIRKSLFDPTGRYVTITYQDGIVSLWDLGRKEKIWEIKAHPGGGIYGLALGPYGHYLATGNYKSTKIWEAKTGRLLHNIDQGTSTLAIDPQGTALLGTGTVSKKDRLFVWDLKTALLRASYPAGSSSQKLIFDQQGRYFFSGLNGDIEIGDISTGKKIRKLQSTKNKTNRIHVAPDGKSFLAIGDASLNYWSLETGKLIKAYSSFEEDKSGAIYSWMDNGFWAPRVDVNGQYLIASNRTMLKVFDLKKGKDISKKFNDSMDKYYAHRTMFQSLEITLDGKYIAGLKEQSYGTKDTKISVFEISTGKKITNIIDSDGPARRMEFDPTGQYLANAVKNHIKLWDFHTGKVVKKFTGHGGYIDQVTFDPTGKYLVSTASIVTNREKNYSRIVDSEIKIWRVENGTSISTVIAPDAIMVSTIVDPSGRYIAAADHHYRIWLFDMLSGKHVRTFPGHSAFIRDLKFTLDSKLLISAGDDSVIKIWNIETGEHLSLMNKGKEWIIFTQDGYFDSSKRGGELVAMTQGLTSLSIDQFAIKKNRPDIILSRLGLGSKQLIAHYFSRYQRRLKRTGFSENQLKSDFHVPKVEIINTKQQNKHVAITFTLKDTRYPLKRYNVYVNDVPIFGALGKPVKGKKIILKESVELTRGKNKIEIAAINESGVESYRAVTYATYKEKPKGDLYFLGFGVSKYKNKALNLQYADKDAKDLALLFQKMEPAYNKVHIKTYLNSEVTPDAIQKSKSFLMQAEVDDTFILFIAGHGVHDADPAATYYYITYNADINNLKGTAADFETIENLLQGIKPRYKLFLMDTCESGEVEDDEEAEYYAMASSRGINARTTRSIKAIMKKKNNRLSTSKSAGNRSFLYDTDRYIYNNLIRRSGTIVFSSSKGGEFSYESNSVANGFFTESIINALSSKKADENKDGLISIDELRKYVSNDVPKYTDNKQHPTVDRDNIFQKFSFSIVHPKI